jgi:hypothetical protein
MSLGRSGMTELKRVGEIVSEEAGSTYMSDCDAATESIQLHIYVFS